MTPVYEVYAVKYAHHERRASHNFIGGDPHDGPMPLDYFVWLVRGQGRELVVDTGFSAAMAAKRGRQHLRCPTEGLRLLGVDSSELRDVVITHLHYDHVGGFELFPRATFHLQEREMGYATGRYMCQECFRGAFEAEDVVGMVRRVYDGRVRFHDGDAEVMPGVSLHLIGGHTMGLQAVRVATRRGAVTARASRCTGLAIAWIALLTCDHGTNVRPSEAGPLIVSENPSASTL
jgi:glyoxylase-like metal-dependent hydrolase (beta-lactamase superfamily II)